MSKFLMRNNVKTELAENITNTTTQFRILNAVLPFRNPPSPTTGLGVRLTIVDSKIPTKIEIIEVETIVTDGPDHRIVTVAGNDPNVGRGVEDTTANSFLAGATIYMANTADMINSKLNKDDSIIVSRQVINIGGVDYMKVFTNEGNEDNVFFFLKM